MKYILGLDQTGAVGSKGRARPFPAALLLMFSARHKILIPQLRLNSLTREDVSSLLRRYSPQLSLADGLMIVDSNLGLPKDCGLTIQDILREARSDNLARRPFGSQSAHEFFGRLRPSPSSLLHREVEQLTGAHSIFLRYPFQRNVSCGTYRVLRDLAIDTSWFNVWPFSKRNRRKALIIEGYPSFYWRTIVGAKERDLSRLRDHLKSKKGLTIQGPWKGVSLDEADALVLCLAGDHYKSVLARPSTRWRREGWILGV